MKIYGIKYRFVAVLLLLAVGGHFSLFHFQMEKQFLCVHDNGYSHIESPGAAQDANNHFLFTEITSESNKIDCVDYNLHSHFDQSIVKITNKIFRQVKTLTRININKMGTDKNLAFVKRENIQLPFPLLDSLQTISLLI